MDTRPPLPPFDADTAAAKVRLAEDGWNSRDPARVALAYTVDSRAARSSRGAMRSPPSSRTNGGANTRIA